jgi:predicted RNA-binding protein associated with RNAse of E/G family
VVSTPEPVRIHYHRLPDRADIYVQRLVLRSDDCVVTLNERTALKRTMMISDVPVLERDSPVIWFTFPGEWHDIGLFHTADGIFTGTYSNILTPVVFHDSFTWETTDLFLDMWVDRDRRIHVLDQDELDTALGAGWIDRRLADRAIAEARQLTARAEAGTWPPPIVREWPLDRVLEFLGSSEGTTGG